VRAGCPDCHGADLGGKAFIDDPAMGTIHSANLTPAGLAAWTDDEIGRAIRHGIAKDGRALFFMPATDFNGLSGGDLASVVAYLRTLPPVERARGTTTLGPVGKLLVATDQIPIAFTADAIDHTKGFAAKPVETASAEFGHYLAQACTGCHTAAFTGGPIQGAPPDWAPAADLTTRGLAGWTEGDFVRTMRTGIDPKGAKLRAPFPVAMTSQMSDVELQALWAFLRTVNPPAEGLAAKANAESAPTN
jgi:hypothetical protein